MRSPEHDNHLNCWFWPTDLARTAPKYWTPKLMSYDAAECRRKQSPPSVNHRGPRAGRKRLRWRLHRVVDAARRTRVQDDLPF